MIVRGHNALTAMPWSQLAGETEHDQAHAELRHAIGGMRGEPFLLHIERRRDHQDVRIGRLLQMGMAHFETTKVPRALIWCIRSNRFMSVSTTLRELDRAGIVDDDVDAAEFLRRLVERVLHHGFVAHIDNQRQRLAAGALDLFGSGIDGAVKLWMRLGGFRRDGDIGAVARGAQRDRKPDAARRAGDEQCFSGKRHRRPHFLRDRNAENAARASSDCQTVLEMHHFGIDLLDDSVKMAAHQPPRHCDGAGRKRGNLAAPLSTQRLRPRGIDHLVDDAGLFACSAESGRPITSIENARA